MGSGNATFVCKTSWSSSEGMCVGCIDTAQILYKRAGREMLIGVLLPSKMGDVSVGSSQGGLLEACEAMV